MLDQNINVLALATFIIGGSEEDFLEDLYTVDQLW